jgi:hypothetical protein
VNGDHQHSLQPSLLIRKFPVNQRQLDGTMTKRDPYFVFGALLLGMLLAVLDSTIVATTLRKLPSNVLAVIVHAIAASIQQIYRWVVALSLLLAEVKVRASLYSVADEIPMSNADPQP